MKYTALVAVALSTAITVPSVAHAQAARRPTTHSAPMVTAAPERAIRRDIPLTDMIRRAFAEGTRDTTGRPTSKYWTIWNDYTINARFDQPASRIYGSETIVVHNNSDSAMHTIQMRLDQNLFAANVPRNEVVTDITDGMKLTKLTVDGQPVDLNPPPAGRGRFGGPAAPVKLSMIGANLTSATIRLPDPIAVGATATIEAEWNFEVPSSNGVRGIRMGRWGDSLYQVGQWYPRVAVYDDLRGWDTDPYLGPSEFYNNLGHYDVHLDMPAGWLVGATGILQNPQDVLTATARERLSHVLESDSQRTIVGADERGPGKSTAAGDRLIWHFVADSVADVAWATSDRFVWDATRAQVPGAGTIPINIFYEPNHAAQYATGGATVRHALQFYSKLWMPYTYPIETMVDGPEGGMEYPMFIMSSTGASDHETGHQWWPMMVQTNETWYPFMDEGFNQYMNILSDADTSGGFHRGGRGGGGGGGFGGAGVTCQRTASVSDSMFRACFAALGRFGPMPLTNARDSARATQVVDSLRGAGFTVALGGRGGFGGGGGRGGAPRTGVEAMDPPGGTHLLNGQGQRFGTLSGNERLAPLMWDANYGGPEYQEQAYGREPMMLSMLGGVVGDSAVWKAMSGYAKAWKFKHPSPWDYAFYMDHALHQDLGWFWYYWLFTTESVDGSIQGVSTTGARTVVTVRQDGQMPSPVVLAVEFADHGPAVRQMTNSRMLDSNTALVTYPVSVWFNGSRTFKANLDFGGRHIAKIMLDPFGRFPDRDVSDNVWPRDSAAVSGRGGRRGRGGQ